MGRVILASCSDNKHHMNTPVSLGVCFTYVKLILKKCEMDFQWETRADDRGDWRHTSRMCVANLERRRITMEAEKRERLKNREQYNEPPMPSPSINLIIIIIIIILD